MKKIIVLTSLLLLGVSSVSPVAALKKRTVVAVPVTSSKKVVTTGPIGVSAKLTGWKQYLKVSFSGAASTNGITYELTYNGNGNEQGVYGSVDPKEGNVTRSIFLGTCSHGACVAHRNVSNISLVVTFKQKNGKNLIKRYKIKY